MPYAKKGGTDSNLFEDPAFRDDHEDIRASRVSHHKWCNDMQSVVALQGP